MKKIFILTLAFLFGSCASEEVVVSDGDPNVIVIGEMVFVTPDIVAPSGATIVILNNDNTPHSVTSESAEDAFDDDGTFDVSVGSDGDGLLTLPEAPSGTVFYFYCKFHTSLMSPSTGTITIE